MLLLSGRARAASPEPVRVDYRADESCPDAEAFLRSIAENEPRTPGARADARTGAHVPRSDYARCEPAGAWRVLGDGVENRTFIGGDYSYIPSNPSYYFQHFRAVHHDPFFGMRCARAAQ